MIRLSPAPPVSLQTPVVDIFPAREEQASIQAEAWKTLIRGGRVMAHAAALAIPQFGSYYTLATIASKNESKISAAAESAWFVGAMLPVFGNLVDLSDAWSGFFHQRSVTGRSMQTWEAGLSLATGIAGLALDLTGVGYFLRTGSRSTTGLFKWFGREWVKTFDPREFANPFRALRSSEVSVAEPYPLMALLNRSRHQRYWREKKRSRRWENDARVVLVQHWLQEVYFRSKVRNGRTPPLAPQLLAQSIITGKRGTGLSRLEHYGRMGQVRGLLAEVMLLEFLQSILPQYRFHLSSHKLDSMGYDIMVLKKGARQILGGVSVKASSNGRGGRKNKPRPFPLIKMVLVPKRSGVKALFDRFHKGTPVDADFIKTTVLNTDVDILARNLREGVQHHLNNGHPEPFRRFLAELDSALRELL
ncbi:MAG: hypothetical protein Q7S68_01650 [Deltaproteobacteria bacterium]|nr:hypothetical protein [Deltaproteobacteria bacterium]